jgi:trigger factor
VTVHEVRAPQDAVLDDAFAQRFGIENFEKLKEAVSEQIDGQHKQASRMKQKRALLDVLDAGHSFDLPAGLVDQEFESIWKEVQHSFEHGHPEPDDVGKSDEELKANYRKIAERRVRLGLVLAEVGRTNKVTLGQDEIGRLISEEARRYPGQEQRVFQFYRDNPAALARLRAPLYEDKVIDHIFGVAVVTEKTVAKDELFADIEGDEPHGHDHDHDHGHVHGPDCDHDH